MKRCGREFKYEMQHLMILRSEPTDCIISMKGVRSVLVTSNSLVILVDVHPR